MRWVYIVWVREHDAPGRASWVAVCETDDRHEARAVAENYRRDGASVRVQRRSAD